MKKTPLLAISALALSGALLTGCATLPAVLGGSGESTTTTAAATTFTGDLSPKSVLAENADATVVNDDEWSADDAVDVKLSGTSAEVDGDASGVAVADGTVTITAAGVYRLSGEFEGQVVIDAPDDAQVVLILDGAKITNSEGAAISAVAADDVAIYLAKGSENSVSDASSYAEDEQANAAINADADLTISGSGSLTVHGNGNDGISSTDDLVVLSGTIAVEAADDALRGKDALVVKGGTLTLSATGGDGLKSDQEDDETKGYVEVSGGTIDISAGDDGVQAQTDTVISDGTLTVDAADDGVKGERIASIGGGTVTVTNSTEALEAANIGIGGGTVSLTATDDGINASGNDDTSTADSGEEGTTGSDTDSGADSGADSGTQSGSAQDQGGGPGGGMGGGGMADTGERLEISGGTVTVDAEGDGLDSNGSLTMSGGDVTVYGPTQGGNGALDANGEMTVSGGTLIAFGAGQMEETPTSDDSQGWVMLSGDISAGQDVSIQDSSGTEVATGTAKKAAGSVIVSNGDISSGESYTLLAGDDELGTGTAGEAAEGGMGGGMPGGGQGGGPGGGQGGAPSAPDGASQGDDTGS